MPRSSALPAGPPGAELTLDAQRGMVLRLQQQLAAAHGGSVEHIETHISFVLVCGGFAWKIKKALRTSFLDQSTLALREHACHEELRLNRRMAPDLYLAVVPITGTPADPAIEGTGALIDVAVMMRSFAQDSLWDRQAARGLLGIAQIDELIQVVADLHAGAAVADAVGLLGSPTHVRAPLLQSLDELRGLLEPDGAGTRISALREWEAAAFARLQPLMAGRLAQGRVRECHGDLHLGNVSSIDGRCTVFDGIEFNDEFRWIDVFSDLAFMVMDLQAHGLARLAHRLVNGYLERCGDYEGLALLDYYRVHRALVRAKVHLMRAAQCGASEAATAAAQRAAAEPYLGLAQRVTERDPTRAMLLITHGFSGSGKSTLTQGLLESAGAIRIRADVERKRLAGLAPLDRSGAGEAAGLYGPDMSAATYARLGRLAEGVLTSGYPVILDATFLRRAERDAARQMASRLGRPCRILDFDVDVQVLRQRLRERAARGRDASDADESVLELQMRRAEPLQPDEQAIVFRCVPASADSDGRPQADWTALLRRVDGVIQ
jgi:uncharacterized protein